MKTFILILKGILLWGTAIITILLISSIDSIIDYNLGIFILLLILELILIKLNTSVISLKEFLTLSGNNTLNSILNNK